MHRILTIIGARPQFIKASAVSKVLASKSNYEEVILHTGQHFDKNMSDVFFNELNIPSPDILLNINGGTHGEMTGRMLEEIERSISIVKPDTVLVYGDTNSTLAGALAAAKLNIKVAHVEAGLRSHNMLMPEEINRILTDNISQYLFCPTKAAVSNLVDEGFNKKPVNIIETGDVMKDASLLFMQSAVKPEALEEDKGFILTTMHRAENTDDRTRLMNIVDAINSIHDNILPVVLPLHPRTKKKLTEQGLNLNAHTIDPVSYLEMLWLLQNCRLVLTDSGGLQKEAFFFQKNCVTMRDETEWLELVHEGVNVLAGAEKGKIIQSVEAFKDLSFTCNKELYGNGRAAEVIVANL